MSISEGCGLSRRVLGGPSQDTDPRETVSWGPCRGPGPDGVQRLREPLHFRIARNGSVELHFWMPCPGEFVKVDLDTVSALSWVAAGRTPEAAVEDAGGAPRARESFERLSDFGLLRPASEVGHLPGPPRADANRDALPIFVLGSHRSGTTLVRWILDAHPRVSCTVDTGVVRDVHRAFWSEKPVPDAMEKFGVPEEVVRGLAAGLVAQVHELMARKQGKPRWAEKCNDYTELEGFISWLFERRCRFVLVVRHGLDVVSSPFFDEFAWRHRGGTVGRPLERRLIEWVQRNGYLQRFASRNPGRCVTVRYEDLVARPEETARRMFEALGEETPEGILARVFEADRGWKPGVTPFEDTWIRQSEEIRPDRTDRWRSWPPELLEGLRPIVNPTLKLWGYDEV